MKTANPFYIDRVKQEIDEQLQANGWQSRENIKGQDKDMDKAFKGFPPKSQFQIGELRPAEIARAAANYLADSNPRETAAPA